MIFTFPFSAATQNRKAQKRSAKLQISADIPKPSLK